MDAEADLRAMVQDPEPAAAAEAGDGEVRPAHIDGEGEADPVEEVQEEAEEGEDEGEGAGEEADAPRPPQDRPPRQPLVFPPLTLDARVTVTISALEQDIKNRSGIDTYVTTWNAFGRWHEELHGQLPPLLPITNAKSNVAKCLWYTDILTATDYVIWMGSPEGGKAGPQVSSLAPSLQLLTELQAWPHLLF